MPVRALDGPADVFAHWIDARRFLVAAPGPRSRFDPYGLASRQVFAQERDHFILGVVDQEADVGRGAVDWCGRQKNEIGGVGNDLLQTSIDGYDPHLILPP